MLFLLALAAATISVFAAPPSVTELGAPAAIGSGEPFLFTTRDGLLLSWLEPVANTKETALRFAIAPGNGRRRVPSRSGPTSS
jgi:hypothetical protein